MKYHRITYIHDEIIDEVRSFDDGCHIVRTRAKALELVNKWNQQAFTRALTYPWNFPNIMYYLEGGTMNITDAALHPDPLTPSTPWERVKVAESTLSWEQQNYYGVWARLLDGKHLFLVLPVEQKPFENDCGHLSIASALKQ